MSVVTASAAATLRPAYDRGGWRPDAAYWQLSGRRAKQVLATTAPFRALGSEELRVLDVGSGHGGMTLELARRCRHVVGLEPCLERVAAATRLQQQFSIANVEFRAGVAESLTDESCYDLVVLDNVLEHLPDQKEALRRITTALAPGGVLFVLVPNRLWPLEVHYRLPLLSYLPLSWANVYLRWTGRGYDYTDASYAPTYWSLNRLLRREPELTFHYVLPADLSLARQGHSRLYRYGVAAIRCAPWLWTISKSLLVVATKDARAGSQRQEAS